MQCAVIEFARNVLKYENANSEEFDENTPYPVIYLMKEWFDVHKQSLQVRHRESEKGGTMRLGAYPCVIKKDTLAYEAYQQREVSERHRHRFEFNKTYADAFESGGMILSGYSPDETLVEIVEFKDHPWFVGCQFHPEFNSNPLHAHPLFREFVRATIEYKK
jgi:CTP synthase